MPERPPFDNERAVFLLIGGVIGFHCLIVGAGVFTCIWKITHLIEAGQTCDGSGRLSELLGSALTAALAFANGFKRKD